MRREYQYLRIRTSSSASVANLGAGFDCLALAVDLWNDYELCVELRSLSPGEPEFTFRDSFGGRYGSADRRIRTVDNNLFVRAFVFVRKQLCKYAGRKVPICPCYIDQKVEIPPIRGLGSSSSATVAGTLAGVEFFRRLYPTICPEKLLRGWGCGSDKEIEFYELLASLARVTDSCPDNICACLSGGLTYSFSDERNEVATQVDRVQRLYFFRDEIEDESLRCIVLVPKKPLSTPLARDVLDNETYSHHDVTFNLTRSTCLPRVFKDRRYTLLREVTKDRIHQRQRARHFYRGDRKTIPINHAFQAAIDAGAHFACISGAGSSLAALADEDRAENVREAFRTAFEDAAPADWVIENALILKLSNGGAKCASEIVDNVPELTDWIRRLPDDAGPLQIGAKCPPGYSTFLSYNFKDEQDAVKISTDLEAWGLSVWRDQQALPVGKRWTDELKAGIENSRSFLICVGEHGIGEFQREEIDACLERAAREGLHVIPVLMKGGPDLGELPSTLRDFQGIDVRNGCSDESIRRVIGAIQASGRHQGP